MGFFFVKTCNGYLGLDISPQAILKLSNFVIVYSKINNFCLYLLGLPPYRLKRLSNEYLKFKYLYIRCLIKNIVVVVISGINLMLCSLLKIII